MTDVTYPAGAARRATVARPWLGLAVMLLGPFMTVMDVMIVNVAIPSIRLELGASYGQAELVVAGYSLAYAVALITGGRLGDLRGRRRMFVAGLLGFALTSALCGLATSAETLILARLLQGVAAALLFPQVFSLIRVTFPEPKDCAKAFAALGVVLGLAAVAGQVLGGILVAADLWGLSWRPIFLLNVPIGLLAAIAAPRLIPADTVTPGQRLDLAGVGLSALGLGLLLYPLIEGREAGWPAWSLAMLAAAVPVLAVFALHQHARSRRGASPLLQTALFRDRAFAVGVLLALVFYSTMNSVYLAYAFLAQLGLGRSALAAGLVFSPAAVSFMIASIAAGRVAPERWRAVLMAGAAIAALGEFVAAATALLAAPLQAEALIPALLLLGIGQGLLLTPLLNTILGGIHDGHIGSASGMLSTMQQVGGAFGVAVAGILFAVVLDGARAAGLGEAAAYARAFAAAAGYGGVATLVTLGLLFALPKGDELG
ncbi:MFS transporter [Inquilinus sp.]|jgi:EmrB/QacA subfamily drug resistance transporter|uniref:MFS transporter n=1 Tax=Inquilinus sp. TaxID=1932117 RepID=UPI0037844A1F